MHSFNVALIRCIFLVFYLFSSIDDKQSVEMGTQNTRNQLAYKKFITFTLWMKKKILALLLFDHIAFLAQVKKKEMK